jgi:hypothetical protein
VLAHADDALEHLGHLRRALGDAPGAAALDASVAGIEAELMALLAEVQRHNTVRQVLEGVSALAAAAVDCGVAGSDRPAALLARFGTLADTYVMEDHRVAHSAALGLPQESSGPRLQLF